MTGPAPRGSGERVLLVEDDASVRTVLGATLQAYGYRVAAAENGAEALDCFRRADGGFAAVLTDVTMPVMDGPRTMRALRALDAHIPLIVMSGLADLGTMHVPQDLDVAAVLTKPFTAGTLLRAVHQHRRQLAS